LVMFGEDREAPTIALTAELTTLLDAVDGQSSDDDIIERVSSQHPDVPVNDVREVLDSLENLGLFEDSESTEKRSAGGAVRYDRQNLYFDLYNPRIGFGDQCQRKLEDMSVVILGCGGVGSNTLLQLAAAGVGRITVVEFDRVELSNLNRSSLFTDGDVGRLKAEVIRDRAWNPDVSVDVRELRIDSQIDMDAIVSPGYDFAILAADKPYYRINQWFNRSCIRFGVPSSSAGCSQRSAAIGPITVPGVTACFACQRYDASPLDRGPTFIERANAKRVAAAFGPVLSTVSGIHAHEVIMFLAGAKKSQLLGNQLVIEFETLDFRLDPVFRDMTCRECGGRR
jgi:molybdopterin-synthase adenylyltransferase